MSLYLIILPFWWKHFSFENFENIFNNIYNVWLVLNFDFLILISFELIFKLIMLCSTNKWISCNIYIYIVLCFGIKKQCNLIYFTLLPKAISPFYLGDVSLFQYYWAPTQCLHMKFGPPHMIDPHTLNKLIFWKP